MSRVTLAQVHATYKKRDAWWTVLLVDPLASRLVRVTAGVSWITPTRLTVAAFLLGLAAAGSFLQATAGWLVLGAGLYHLGFVLDCMDGKLARLRGTGSLLGTWLDFLLDRVRVFLCVMALFGGQLLHTDNPVFLLAACAVIFLALFIYLNGAEIDRAWTRMVPPAGAGGSPGPNGSAPVPGVVARVRAALHRRRIRLNLVSGVEFEMAVLVVAPVAAALWGSAVVLWVTGVAGALLVGFELALIARFLITARSYDRRTRRTPVPAPRVDLPDGAERTHRPV